MLKCNLLGSDIHGMGRRFCRHMIPEIGGRVHFIIKEEYPTLSKNISTPYLTSLRSLKWDESPSSHYPLFHRSCVRNRNLLKLGRTEDWERLKPIRYEIECVALYVRNFILI
ncbi:hypothetical protein D5086_020066 [Populus alba]|uniref:Uncharacterized protein n=1 Tax=Populus alba TaxID=43335 RepID=A0ACC4BJ05_POPAL